MGGGVKHVNVLTRMIRLLGRTYVRVALQGPAGTCEVNGFQIYEEDGKPYVAVAYLSPSFRRARNGWNSSARVHSDSRSGMSYSPERI